METTAPDLTALYVTMGVSVAVSLVVGIIALVALWKTFVKAGEPGWAVIIPIYNSIVMLKIVGRPLWWVVLMLIPLVNIVVGIIVMIDFAKSFGKGAVFGFFGLVVFSIVGFCILGFGSARYVGPAAAQGQVPQGYPQNPGYQGA